MLERLDRDKVDVTLGFAFAAAVTLVAVLFQERLQMLAEPFIGAAVSPGD